MADTQPAGKLKVGFIYIGPIGAERPSRHSLFLLALSRPQPSSHPSPGLARSRATNPIL
jgi:hypothetical protein